MADMLRTADFLPSRFNGDTIDSDLARSHWLGFADYLEVHNLDEPENDDEISSNCCHF